MNLSLNQHLWGSSIILAGLGVANFAVACSSRNASAQQQAQVSTEPKATHVVEEPSTRAVRPDPPPVDEFRGVFITTAYNLDWPTEPGLHKRLHQDEIDAVISRAKSLNCNVILLQVRAFGDRMYENAILDSNKYYEEPWAMSLNFGKDPGYDPLQEWVTACDEADIELHFWINPFRVNKLVKIKQPGGGDDVYLPVIMHKKQLWLDPQNRVVRQYVLDVVAGLLANYGHGSQSGMRGARSSNARAMEEDDGGGDGVIYDHYIPDDGKKRKRAGKDDNSSEPPKAKRTQAEKRLEYLYNKYLDEDTPKLPDDTFDDVPLKTIMEGFIEESSAIVRKKHTFGYSPEADGPQAKWAQEWLGGGHFDYVVPELYFTRFQGQNPPNPAQSQFKSKLEEWLAANTWNGPRKPLVVAGLHTTRVQKPEGPKAERWPELEIRAQMADVRAARVGQQRAAGEAHYSASALRLPDQGGPGRGNNLAERLKRTGGHYGKPAIPPAFGVGARPGTPIVQLDPERPGVVVWGPAAQDPDPHRWVVWVSRGGNWGDPKIVRGNITEHKLQAGEDAVWVKAIGKGNQQSDFGKWPVE